MSTNPHTLADKFLIRCRRMQNAPIAKRRYLIEKYEEVIGTKPKGLTSTQLWLRIAYELQIQGYAESGKDLPDSVESRYLEVLRQEEHVRKDPELQARRVEKRNSARKLGKPEPIFGVVEEV